MVTEASPFPDGTTASMWTAPRDVAVVRIRLGAERPAVQPDPLGRATIGYAAGLSVDDLWQRGRGIWKARLTSVAEADLAIVVHDGVVVLVATIDGAAFHEDRVAIEGRPLPHHPLLGKADPVPNQSRNPIAYGTCFTVVPSSDAPRDPQTLMRAAVDVLSQAVRLRRPVLRPVEGRPGAWEPDPDRTEPDDWAEFVTVALAGAAANAGGIDDALAGRPGSWEAAGVRSLLESTVGPDESGLWAHRTEPVEVVIDVENLLIDTDVWAGYDQAERELEARYEAAVAADPEPDPSPYMWIYSRTDGSWAPVDPAAPAWTIEAWRAGNDFGAAEERWLEHTTMTGLPRSPELAAEYDRLCAAREARLDPLRPPLDELEAQRLRETAAWGQALKGRVEEAARALPGLNVPVTVTVNTTRPGGMNPQAGAAQRDGLAARLLEDALVRIPSPDLLPGTPLSRLLASLGRDA